MTKVQNIKAILECNFAGFKEEIIDIAVSCIMSLDQEPCDDAISREATLRPYKGLNDEDTISIWLIRKNIEQQPSVKPQYTDDEIKKMQDLEQAEIQKAYKLGKAETGRWIENLCDSCTNKACEFQSGIQRSKCDFYIPPMLHLEPDNCGNYVVQQEPKVDEENIHREREQAYMQGYEDACKKYRQEPKTGHWIRVTDDAGYLVWECDKCGWQQIFKTNFCPDCGAKMIEPQERSDKE